MLNKVLATLTLLFLTLLPASAAVTGNATLNGTYAFQVYNVDTAWGYYNNSGKFIPVNGNFPGCQSQNGKQPQYNCQGVAYLNLSSGTFEFDGKGHVKFLSFAQYSLNGGGGPPLNVLLPYTVSGTTANIVLTGKHTTTITLALGNYNANGIATSATILIIGTGDLSPNGGVAFLQ